MDSIKASPPSAAVELSAAAQSGVGTSATTLNPNSESILATAIKASVAASTPAQVSTAKTLLVEVATPSLNANALSGTSGNPGTSGRFPLNPTVVMPSNPLAMTSAAGTNITGGNAGAGSTPNLNPVNVLVAVADSTASTGNVPANNTPQSNSLLQAALADVYHGADTPVSSTLLTQKGVGAYVQLLNALAGNELHQKSADVLTTNLQSASAALRLSYYDAASRLPPQLASKDWGFSVSNGNLVFTSNNDELFPHELTLLRIAFTGSNVEPAAKQLAAVITSIEQMRKAGAESVSLAWAQFDVQEDNFADVVDLRTYVTSTVPGGNYHPNTPAPVNHSQIPPMLGGMDLRGLVTARPKFLRADGSVSSEAVEELDVQVGVPPEAPQAATLHGQCSCGQLQFIVQDEFEYAFYCHCSRCRARTGSVFAAIAGIGIDKIEVIAGHEHLLLEGECSDGYGARCSHCYSFLFAAVRGRQYAHVSLGSLIDSPTRAPDHHIYVGSKAPWYQIADRLPQYDELP